MRVTRAVLLVVAVSALAAPAFAQAPAPRTEPGSGYRAYVVFDRVSFAAEQSFDAVLRKTSLDAIGAGGEFRFWKGLFARGVFSTMEETGTRAFIVSGQPVSVGVPLTISVRPIEIAAGSIGNRFVGEKVRPVADRVREGKSFAASLEGTGQFANMVVEMTKVGETTGSLAEMLGSVADFSDEEIENKLNIMMAMLTPLLLIVMGGFVALILLALYLPLFGLAGVLH